MLRFMETVYGSSTGNSERSTAQPVLVVGTVFIGALWWKFNFDLFYLIDQGGV